MLTPIHIFYFKSGQNWHTISGRKSTLYWLQKTKHILASLGETSGTISAEFFL